MLRAMADIVMNIAQAAGQQAIRQAAQEGPSNEPASGLLVTRLARALRQIIALDARLAQDQANPAISRTAQSRRAAADRRHTLQARAELRRHLRHAVDRARIADRESLFADLEDRLQDDDIDLLLATTSITRIVVTLCAEFGLEPDYGQWTDAELEAANGAEPRGPHAHPPPSLANTPCGSAALPIASGTSPDAPPVPP